MISPNSQNNENRVNSNTNKISGKPSNTPGFGSSFAKTGDYGFDKTRKQGNESEGQPRKRKSTSLEESSLPLANSYSSHATSMEGAAKHIVGIGANNKAGASTNNAAPQYQSCDRCRSKKIKCTYSGHSLNQCLSCIAASLECRNNDKLLRKSSPRGYTELLEETCRNLEIEIKSLKSMYANVNLQGVVQRMAEKDSNLAQPAQTEASANIVETGHFKVAVKSDCTTEEEDGHSSKKSSFLPQSNGYLQKEEKLDVKDPPGLTASKIIQNTQNGKGPFQTIPLLVTLASPRSTMEVLFSAQLIAKIGLNFGFLNRECLYTSKLLSSLKDDFERLDEKNEILSDGDVGKLLRSNVDLRDIDDFIGLFEYFFVIDTRLLVFQEIEELIIIYFDNWSTIVPMFLKLEFLKTFQKFRADYLNYQKNGKVNSNYQTNIPTPINYKIFMCKLLVMVQMSLSSINKPSHRMQNLIKLLITNPFFHADNTSISSLQFLTLALHLFSSTSPQEQILYHLRSLNCMMVQQLRLQRCPQSIVNAHGQQSDIVHRRTRRLLFWSNYILDGLVSFQLGVPRLIKDEDSEVLLPFDEPSLNGVDAIVEPVGLQILKLGIIFGGVLDGLFKKFHNFEKVDELLKQEILLENWYKNLPANLTFEINAEGSINFELLKIKLREEKAYGVFNLIFVYFFCKSMIHLTLVSIGSEFGKDFKNYENTLEVGGGIVHPTKIDSYIKLHQYSEVLLELISISYKLNYKIVLPVFIPNLVVKFSLLGLERALEYKKSCELFLHFRKLIETLVDQSIAFKKIDSKSTHGTVGSLSWYSIKLFDITLSLLLLVNTKESKETKEYFQKRVNQKILKLIKKKACFYEGLIKAEVGLKRISEYNGGDDKFENTYLDKQIKYRADVKRPDSLLSNIEKLSGRQHSSQANDFDEEDDEDDNGLEFKTVPKAHRLSRDVTSVKANDTVVKLESPNSLDDTDLEKYTMKWDGSVNTLTNVFKKDPVLSFGDLNQFFVNSQVGISSMTQQQHKSDQQPLSIVLPADKGKSLGEKISPIREVSNTISNSSTHPMINLNYSQSGGHPSSYSTSTKTLSDKEEQYDATKSVFSNVKHAVYANGNSQISNIKKATSQSLKSPSEALLTKLSNSNIKTKTDRDQISENPTSSRLDWTETNGNNIIPNMSVNNVKKMNCSEHYDSTTSFAKPTLLDFGFDNVNINLFSNNENYRGNASGNGETDVNGIISTIGINNHNLNAESNNSFIFDGSMGLAQFLDMSYIASNKRKISDTDENYGEGTKKPRN